MPTYYIGLHDLIGNKEATDRPQDRADVDVLRRGATAKIVRPLIKKPILGRVSGDRLGM